jgi:hypothetical protein
MAILKFRAYWEEDEVIYRDIAIKHTQSFQELHNAILLAYAFDSKHAATFYKSNDAWQMGREITLERYDYKSYKVEPLLMAETTIGSQVADPNQKFIYEYDFEKGWRFMLELIQIDKEANPKLDYPCCVRKEGLGPQQYGTKNIIDQRMTEMEEKYDLNPDALMDGFGEEGEVGTESNESTDEAAGDDAEAF